MVLGMVMTVVLVVLVVLVVVRMVVMVTMVMRQLMDEAPLPPVLATPAFTTTHRLMGTRDRGEPRLRIAHGAVVLRGGQ